MQNLIENRRVLRMQFEAFANYARHESERPEIGILFRCTSDQRRQRLARTVGGLCGDVSENRTQAGWQGLKAIHPAGIMVAQERDRIHGALHCVCI